MDEMLEPCLIQASLPDRRQQPDHGPARDHQDRPLQSQGGHLPSQRGCRALALSVAAG